MGGIALGSWTGGMALGSWTGGMAVGSCTGGIALGSCTGGTALGNTTGGTSLGNGNGTGGRGGTGSVVSGWSETMSRSEVVLQPRGIANAADIHTSNAVGRRGGPVIAGTFPPPRRGCLRRYTGSRGAPCLSVPAPWFDYYDADADAGDLEPPENLANVTSVGEMLGVVEDPFVPVDPANVVALGVGGSDAVTDGKW